MVVVVAMVAVVVIVAVAVIVPAIEIKMVMIMKIIIRMKNSNKRKKKKDNDNNNNNEPSGRSMAPAALCFDGSGRHRMTAGNRCGARKSVRSAPRKSMGTIADAQSMICRHSAQIQADSLMDSYNAGSDVRKRTCACLYSFACRTALAWWVTLPLSQALELKSGEVQQASGNNRPDHTAP
jgi:hypothetical protein